MRRATCRVECLEPRKLLAAAPFPGAALDTYTFQNLPVLGRTEAGQEIPLGGFSGLLFDGYSKKGNLRFITHTDRGPNAEPTGILRPFLLPEFNPEIIRFELNPSTGRLTLTDRTQLRRKNNRPLTGLPNIALGSNANAPYNDEIPVDLFGNVLPLDTLGGDFEGIARDDRNGTFWMVDEYRPAIYHFNKQGKLMERFVPVGTAAAAGKPAGTFGKEVLPAVLAQRRQNRGFEAVAFQDGKVLAFVQSPLRNPTSLSNATLNGLRNVRVVEFDPKTLATRQFVYVMDNPNLGGEPNTRADKIGDATALGNGEFLVVERDDDAIDSDAAAFIEKKVYRFSLDGATDVSALPDVINGKTVDQMTPDELAAAGVTPVGKTLHVDLNEVGYNTVEKVEGLAFLGGGAIAVVNDNDFTVANITVDQATGTFVRNAPGESIVLGIIRTQSTPATANEASGSVTPLEVQTRGEDDEGHADERGDD